MIRINLLPKARKQASAQTGGIQGWLIGYAAAVAITVVVVGFIYVSKQRELNEQLAQNAELNREITRLEQQSANIDQVRAQIEQSRQLETVVNDLQRARYGPTAVLMELSRILSLGGGPTVDPQRLEEIRHQNPLASFNPGWEPRRLWMRSLTEEERRCTMTGTARTNEDIAELLRRLALSDRFTNVVLVRTQGVEDQRTRLLLIEFELTAEVIY